MKYCISEIQYDENLKNNAAVKARDDVTRILSHMGMKRIILSDRKRVKTNPLSKITEHVKIAGIWNRALSVLGKGDVLYVQFPPVLHTVFFVHCIRILQKRGVRVVLLIHDLELIRWKKKKNIRAAEKLRFEIEEKSVLLAADGIIAHNDRMKDLLTDLSVDASKITCLGIFDYLIPGYGRRRSEREGLSGDGSVIIAGNLARHKAGYVYDLPDDVRFELFGTNYDAPERDNICYRGSVKPEELPFLMKGSFGLVWDGESTETCSGVYGEYLSYNNPHKTSLYLASGIPVVIWEGAALAEFVKENHCGITISSLQELGGMLSSISDDEYNRLRRGAARIGRRLRHGFMTSHAAKRVLRK